MLPTVTEVSAIDPRLLRLSYSSRLTLHACPRKYQLYKLQSVEEVGAQVSESVTFAYGHAVGIGVQSVLERKSEDDILWDTFMGWDFDLLGDNAKQNKSFWGAVSAVEKFQSMSSLLEDYTLAVYNGKPAVELSFRILFPDGFSYIGFIDAVLIHNFTGDVLILENKTTASNSVNAATYKNSAQAVGYSTVLDAIVPDCSSYHVMYCVYMTKAEQYEVLKFVKTRKQRANWLMSLLLDIEQIKTYHGMGYYPMNGESCYNFFRECEYFGSCERDARLLQRKLTQEVLDKWDADAADMDISITFADLIEAQEKVIEAESVEVGVDADSNALDNAAEVDDVMAKFGNVEVIE